MNAKAAPEQGGQLDFDDSSLPEVVRQKLGCSKNAFKQALGALCKSRRIKFEKPGIKLLDNTLYSRGVEIGSAHGNRTRLHELRIRCPSR